MKRLLPGYFLLLSLWLPNAFAGESPMTERLYLSGKDRTDTVNWEFRVSAGDRAGQWAQLPVPSNWEMQGFGTLSYGSVTPSEKGEYRHRFTAPSAWKDRRIMLVFEGVMTDTLATLNGRQVGPMHQGGFYRFKYDVTQMVKLGEENLLEVAVDETSANAGVNKAERTGDYWNFGGIFRPVWLEALPVQAIERVAIDARADGSFSLDAFVEGQGDGKQVEVRILAKDGTEVGTAVAGLSPDGKTRLQTKLTAPKLWTAETPHLYSAEIRLLAGDRVLHTMRERFGFRSFEVRLGDGLYLNGQRIILQGANRHSFNATSGRCLSEADHREDITLMKEMNANAVRMSHYPPDERFLELCDELGLYVLDELAGWQKGYDTPVGKLLVAEMLKRDVNHPSILFWDNGNEGGENKELDGEYAKWDPQGRPVLHPWGEFGGLNTAHYRIYPQLSALLKGLHTSWRYDPNDKPVMPAKPFIYMPTEFLHGLFDGGAGAGMEDYWTMMRQSPLLGGGFVWAWMDEGVLRPGTGKIDVMGNAAPDGILGPRREKEGSFFTIKELWSPLVLSERELPSGFDGNLTLENRYSFTDASACRFTWQLRRMPLPSSGGGLQIETLATRTMAGPQVAPGQKGRLHLDLPPDWSSADVLALRADDPLGNEVWTWTWPLAGLTRARDLPVGAQTAISAAASIENTGGQLLVHAGSLQLSFNRTDGRLASFAKGERKLSFSNGPRLAVGKAELRSLDAKQDGADVLVTARYTGALEQVEWRVRASGWVDCSYSYAGTAGSTFQGVCFDYPADKVKSKSWVGNGPYRVWQNRLRGGSLGYWTTAYNDTITGWSGFDYPEFKGVFSKVQWLTLETSEGRLTIVPGSDEIYVQVLKPDMPPEKLQMKTAIQLPEAGLAFLHVIPAIGNKFHTAEETGPQGFAPSPKDRYTGKVSFRLEE